MADNRPGWVNGRLGHHQRWMEKAAGQHLARSLIQFLYLCRTLPRYPCRQPRCPDKSACHVRRELSCLTLDAAPLWYWYQYRRTRHSPVAQLSCQKISGSEATYYRVPSPVPPYVRRWRCRIPQIAFCTDVLAPFTSFSDCPAAAACLHSWP